MQALLHFRNLDSTSDLNSQIAGFIKRGILSGGDILTIPGQLKVDITPFKLMGVDGMVVVEPSQATRLDMVAGRTNVIVLKSKYLPDAEPIMEFQVLDISAYNADIEKDYMTVFGTVTLANGATEVSSLDISKQLREVVEPLGRSGFRGYAFSTAELVTQDARAGDFYIVSSGSGDVPSIFSFNGVDYINITESVLLASNLNAHKNNLVSNEKHMSDAQKDAAQGTAGAPSDTNRYVTSQDPRLPTQDQKDALSGLPSNPIPSGSNPYVTASYVVAQPTEIALSSGASAVIQLFPVQGPFYVGMGGVASVKNYFKFYHVDAGGEPREFTDSVAGNPVQVFKVYKDAALSQELNPAGEVTVINDNGFWTGSLYITYTGTLAYDASRLLYGKKTTLQSIDRGMFLKPTPMSAQTSQEAVQKAQEISGYLWDQTVSVPETNKELRKSVVELLRYLETGTASSYVVDSSLFPKLRETQFASDFPQDLSESISQAGNLSYAVVQSATFDAAYTTFDSALNSSNTDSDYTALINYMVPASAVQAGTIKPGYLFCDQAGTKFRILAVNPSGNGALLLYTGGKKVAAFTTGGSTIGAIYQDNNPKGLELISDFQTSLGTEVINFQDIEETKEIDGLPVGGITVGTFATTSTLPQTVLPLMGSATGVTKGRTIYNVLPKKQGNRFDKRVSLIGSWSADGSKALARHQSAIQFTGKLTNLAVKLDKTADLSGFTLSFYVDGAFVSSQSLALPLYPHVDLLKASDKHFTVTMVSNLTPGIHNVRVEISGPVGLALPIYGLEVVNNAATMETAKGRVHSHLVLNKQDTAFQYTPDTTTHVSAKKVLTYMDAVNQAVTVTEVMSKEAEVSGDILGFVPVSEGTTTFTQTLIESKLRRGDVMLFTKTNAGAFVEMHGTDTALRRITNASFTNPVQFDLDAAVPFGLVPNDPTYVAVVRQLFTIPVDSAGTPKLQAVNASEEMVATQEYARWKLSDLAVGNELDLGGINPFAEDRTTVLSDGSTTFSVRQCQKTTTDLVGYDAGVQFTSASSSMTMQIWGTRADIVFAGKNGASTIDVYVDGYTYTLALQGNGIERHTLYFDSNSCFHTIQLRNASTPANVVVAEWIAFDLKTPKVNGVPLSETVICGTGDVVYSTSTDISVLKLPVQGSRFLDFIKYVEVIDLGTGGTKDWTYTYEPTTNPVNGYVLKTDRTGAKIKVKVPVTAKKAIVYFNDGATSQKAVYTPANGEITYTNSVASGTTITIYGIAIVEDGIVQARNLDDKSSSYTKFQSYKDLRNYLSITADNVGVTQGTGSEGTSETTEEAGLGAALEPFSGYESMVFDELDAYPNLPTSPVYASFTNAAYNPTTKTYRIKCDKNRLVTTTTASVNFTLNAAPSFEIKPGDVIVVGNVARRIATVSTQTSGTLDVAFSASNNTNAVCMVSQAVWTKDLVSLGDSTQKTRPMDRFPGVSVKDCVIYFEDSLVQADTTFDVADNSRLAYIASSDGLQGTSGMPSTSLYGTLQTRQNGATSIVPTYSLPASTNNQRLFLAFFCNPDELAVTDGANLLYYDVSFHNAVIDFDGGAAMSALAWSDGSTTPKNCTIDSTSGVTILTLTNWTLTPGVGAGQVMGDVDVLIDGKDVDQKVVGTTPATDITWETVTGRPDQIKFSHNLSVSAVPIKIKKRFGSKDLAPSNRALLANQLGLTVGTPLMVSNGTAAYSSLQSAHDAASNYDVITLLAGVTVTETVTITKPVYIQGKGYGSYLNGNLNINSGANYTVIKGIRYNTGTIAASGCMVTECFFTTAPTDTGVANYVQGIEV